MWRQKSPSRDGVGCGDRQKSPSRDEVGCGDRRVLAGMEWGVVTEKSCQGWDGMW